MSGLVTRDGYDVVVRHPEYRSTVKWTISFPAANELHEALSKVLVDNMITMRAPLGVKQYAEHEAQRIIGTAYDYLRQSNVSAVEQLSALRELVADVS